MSVQLFFKYRCKTSKLEIHKVVGPNATLPPILFYIKLINYTIVFFNEH